MRRRRAVRDHIGTVHAIAMCSMVELAAGTMTEVTIPAANRWIPRGMSVEYLEQATTDLTAVATPDAEPDGSEPGDYPVRVEVRDAAGTLVLRAMVTMWVSLRRHAAQA
jgi:hypothetical protein